MLKRSAFLVTVDIFYCVSSDVIHDFDAFAFGKFVTSPRASPKEHADPIMLRVATLVAIGVASVNAAAILETYPLTADCDVRSPFEPLVGFPRDK